MSARGLPLLLALSVAACTPGTAAEDGMSSETSSEDESTGDEGGSTCGKFRRPPDIPEDVLAQLTLIDNNVWEQIEDPDADPLADHRPDEIDCGPLGWEIEVDGFEVETISCNYMGASQPTLVDLCAGDTIEFDFQHFNLISSDAAQAHVVIAVGDQTLLDYTVDIDPELGVEAKKWVEEVEVTQDMPAGTPVYLHVHNHGFNTYKILTLDLLLPPGQ